MDQNHHLPYKVGQLAESRSFIAGFRAAWFRCKIKGIKSKKGLIVHILEFFDFPDEKLNCTQLYQKNPNDKYLPHHEKKLHLMVRPCFPSLYSESHIPELHKISGVVAIVVDDWKVGDLVDWWCDGCYWSGRVTCLLGNDKVQIELPEPPWGEGKSYEGFCKDLRPSLDWSPEHGWTVPKSTDSETGRYCARLIQPLNQERCDEYPLGEKYTGIASDKSRDSRRSADFSSSNSSLCSSLPPTGPSHLPTIDALKQIPSHGANSDEMHTAHETRSLDKEQSETEKGSWSDIISLSHDKAVADALHATTSASSKDQYECRGPSKMMRISEDERMASLSHCDTIESSILGLEELAIKIKWVKGILKFGSRWSDSTKPSWKFLEKQGFTQR